MLLLMSVWGIGYLVQNQAYANDYSTNNQPICSDKVPSCMPKRAMEKLAEYKNNDLSTYKMMEYVLNNQYLDNPDKLKLKSKFYLIEAINNSNMTNSVDYQKYIDSDSGRIVTIDGSILYLTNLPEEFADILSKFSSGQQTVDQYKCNLARYLSGEKDMPINSIIDSCNMLARILLVRSACFSSLIEDYSKKEHLACCCKGSGLRRVMEAIFPKSLGCHHPDRCDDCSGEMKRMRERKIDAKT